MSPQNLAALKENRKKYAKWKNRICSGINNYILKHEFPASLSPEDQAKYAQILQSGANYMPAKIRGHFMGNIRRWWTLNRGIVVNKLIAQAGTGDSTYTALQNFYNYGEGDPSKQGLSPGWNRTPAWTS